MKLFFISVTTMFFLMLFQPTLLACASCGSGSGDAIFLSPTEKFKLYSAARIQNFVYRLGSDGDKSSIYDVSQQRYLDVGIAYRLFSRGYVSVYSGAQFNHSEDRSEPGFQQPLFASRLTLSRMDISRSWLPQVQLLMSYKPKFFRDRYGSQDVQGLDVFGSGHHEYSLGYDAFNNLSKVFWGVSQSLRLSSRTDLGQGLSAQPGLMSSYIASVGTAFHKSNKIMAGYILGVRSPRKSNGQDVADTKMTSHGLYVGADYKIKADTQVRATFTAAGLGNSKNTARTGGLTLGLFHTWL